MTKKLISVVTPCYNEEENVAEVYRQVREVFARLPGYRYEHIFIDNASKDGTVAVLKALAREDRNLKIIVNARNFGALRSGNHVFLQAYGDAVIQIVADLQDPPAMIEQFLRKWEEGCKIVIGVKRKSGEKASMFWLRKLYYHLIERAAEVDHIKDFTGFGLFDKSFVDTVRRLRDPYPYFRGLVAELGSERHEIEYEQPARTRGMTKNNLYVLYETAMLGFVNHSKLPLRLSSFVGFSVALLSLMIAVGYLVYKLLFWYEFQIGMAPLVIGIFFLGGLQLFFLGVIGEYIGAIFTQVKQHPLVIEKERVNFDA